MNYNIYYYSSFILNEFWDYGIILNRNTKRNSWKINSNDVYKMLPQFDVINYVFKWSINFVQVINLKQYYGEIHFSKVNIS
jgi:hypothetical protein